MTPKFEQMFYVSLIFFQVSNLLKTFLKFLLKILYPGPYDI